MFDHLKINSTVYAVHKKHAGKKLPGGKLQVCKVKSFYNEKGEILPLLKVVGTSAEISANTYKVYINLSEAIDAIRN